MRILLASHVFAPAVGGIETMSATLADEFTRRGHEVRVVTQTPNPAPDAFAYEVVRQPGKAQLLRLARWCDVFFHNNISLQTAWAALAARKPWVVTHQTWLMRADGSLGLQNRVKRLLLRYATGVAISQAVADHVMAPTTIIGNCYNDNVFHEMPDVRRDKDLVFVGRLVQDKGVDLLLEALAQLRQHNLHPGLTIIGDGAELAALRSLTAKLLLTDRVDFVGPKTGEELVRLLNQHRIMVIPSRWREPFGIVALEGIACGCVTVGSAEGGLIDAIGPCGVTFPNGNAEELSRALAALLISPDRGTAYRSQAEQHLSQFKAKAVADAYLRAFKEASSHARLPQRLRSGRSNG